MANEELISNENSAGLMKDYALEAPQGKAAFGYRPKFEPQKSLKLIRNDPVVRAAIITLVDKVVEGGWRIEGKDKRSKTVRLEEALREVRFDRLLRKAVYNLILYNNAFIEIIKDGKGELQDLNILETDFMQIDAEPNGDILGYYQDLGRHSKNPYWEADDVVHLKLDDFTTNVWSELNVEAIYETVLIKDYIRVWLSWFFRTNQLRTTFGLKDANQAKVKEFLGYLKAAEKYVDRPIPYEGEMVVARLQEFDKTGMTVMELLRWCDEQIMVLLQVPPIAVGFPDKSGRSNSVEQDKSLYTRVKTIHRILEDDLSYDLFPKIQFSKARFRFNIPDESTRERVLTNVQTMRNSQFTPDAIEEYLSSQGFVFDTDKVLMSQEDIMQMSNKDLGTGNEGMKGNKSADAAQSRKRQNSADVSKANQQEQKK